MERTTDMTKGSVLKLLLTFSFPLLLTNLGQQLYMIVDAAIVGRGVGVKALAAVLNIGLDILFVMVFRWGIFGAAFASVISQLVSFIYCFFQIKTVIILCDSICSYIGYV